MSQSTLSGSRISTGSDTGLSYFTTRINRWTFSNTKIRSFVEEHLQGRVLNATSGKTKLDHDDIVRNDIDTDRDADVHVDVATLDEVFDAGSFDTIVYDPPFTKSQADATYGSDAPGYGREIKQVFDRLLTEHGQLIQVGYTTYGMPLEWGYERKSVGLMNTFGRQFDILVTVDERSDDPANARPHFEETVVMNHSPKRRGQDTPFTLKYDYSESENDAREQVQAFLNRYARGWTIDLYSRQPSVTDAKIVLQNSVDESPTHLSIDQLEIGDDIPYRFNTIVFNPTEDTFLKQTEYDGEMTGIDAAVKREIDKLLTEHGRVIQIGRTSSLMPDSIMDDGMDYRREAVGVFSYEDANHDIIVTVDEREPTRHLGASDSTDSSSLRSGPTKFQCYHCNDEWYVADYPALNISCPECGAAPGTFCIDTIDGTSVTANPRTPREGMHQEREEWARERLDEMECTHSDHGHLVLENSQYLPFTL